MTATDLVYPIFIFSTLLLTITFIPRNNYRKYVSYGVILGGLLDVLVITIIQNILGIVHFKNQGIFYVLGHNALSPIGWTLTMGLFLYFLPQNRILRYFYLIAWSALAVGFGYIVHNANLFDFQSWWYPLPGFIAFLGWFWFATWIFTKTKQE